MNTTQGFLINKKQEFDDFAILDCAITASERFVVCLADANNSFYNIYEDACEMDMKCHEFISLALSNTDAKTIISDCSIGYIPSVIRAVQKHSKNMVYNRHKASKIERIMRLLIINN